jgi:hypothetical protein
MTPPAFDLLPPLTQIYLFSDIFNWNNTWEKYVSLSLILAESNSSGSPLARRGQVSYKNEMF